MTLFLAVFCFPQLKSTHYGSYHQNDKNRHTNKGFYKWTLTSSENFPSKITPSLIEDRRESHLSKNCTKKSVPKYPTGKDLQGYHHQWHHHILLLKWGRKRTKMAWTNWRVDQARIWGLRRRGGCFKREGGRKFIQDRYFCTIGPYHTYSAPPNWCIIDTTLGGAKSRFTKITESAVLQRNPP